MGQAAVVYCRCYELGRATPPPFPVEWLEVGEFNRPVLAWALQAENRRSGWAMAQAIDKWRASACEHPGMRYIHRGNWTYARVGRFKDELLGLGNFPTLQAALRTSSGGIVSAEMSSECLAELYATRLAVSRLSRHNARRIFHDHHWLYYSLRDVFTASVEVENPVCWL